MSANLPYLINPKFHFPLNQYTKGIFTSGPDPGEPEIIERLFTDLNVSQCIFGSEAGIELDGHYNAFNSVTINANHFENCLNGIIINAFTDPDPDFVPYISNNIMSGDINREPEFGISLTNGNEAIVISNSVTNFTTGINLDLVNTPHIIENFISAEAWGNPGPGILSVSSDGEMRKNIIQHHS